MDTSETYIKMCEKAEEIQTNAGSNFTKGSFAYDKENSRVVIIDRPLRHCKRFIWLPRQDQLQEMMSEYIQEQLGIIHSEIKQAFLDFSSWLSHQYLPEPFVCVPTNCFETGEQLWLAFVMKEKYNKVWDGIDWVKG